MLSKFIQTLFLILLLSVSFSTAQPAFADVREEEGKQKIRVAEKLLQKEDYYLSLRFLEDAKELLSTSNSHLEYLLAKANLQGGDLDDAVKAVNAYFELTPETESTSAQYIEMLALVKEIEKAKSLAEKALVRLPKEMVKVSGGCFKMMDSFKSGSPEIEMCVDSFAIGKYEVTQALWQVVMGENPSEFISGPDYPVETVEWYDIEKFLVELNLMTKKKYRLPTEVEWEYACRSRGKDQKYCGGKKIDKLGWYDEISGETTHPVGKKKSNGLGLYDMSGNVMEWCSDWFDVNGYDPNIRKNPTGPSIGRYRVFRGGSWYTSAENAQSAARYRAMPGFKDDYVGFRLVLPVDSDGR